MARGIHVNDANASYADIGSVGIDLTTLSFTICGWMRIRGNNGGDRGQCPFAVSNLAGSGVTIRDNTFDGTSPWALAGYDVSGTTEETAVTWTPATDEDYFFAMAWSSADSQWTFYGAIDGAGALTSVQGSLGRTGFTIDNIRIAGQHFGSYTHNIDATNVKVWSDKALSSAQLFAEMNSEAVVLTDNLYAHWKLSTSSDMTDYSGNAHDLTATGTLTGATMDPQDIVTAGPSVTNPGFQNLETLNLSGRLQE